MISSIRKFNYYLIILLFGLQICIVFSQVIWRFIFNDPFSWSEELARYLQVWIILFSTAVCIEKSRHLSVDYLKNNINPNVRRYLQLLCYTMVSVFSISIIIFGIQFILTVGYQKTSAIQLPIGYVYLAFPIAGIHMFLETIIIIKKIMTQKFKY